MVIDFLKTETSREKLAAALQVLREFKECESKAEWLMVPFDCWVKFEQLVEYLDHLVDGKELADDTKEQLRR